MDRTSSHVVARAFVASVALAAVLLLVACDGGTGRTTGAVQAHGTTASTTPTSPTAAAQWQLVWLQAAGDTAGSPVAAFTASAMARDPRGGLHAPAAAWWLAQGPGFALALAQLDPAGQSVGFVVLARGTSLGPNWSLVVASQLERPTASSGREWQPLPGGDYSCTGYDVRYAPALTAMLCLSPSRVFFYGRFTLAAARPMGVATVTVNGREGWLSSADVEGFVNAVVVPLADGATYVFGGSAPARQLATLAADLENSVTSQGE